MFRNPYDVKTEKEDHDLYWKAYLLGKRDGIFNRRNLFSRRWPPSYRWGYTDGFNSGSKFNEGK